jgi:glucose-6-phosphate 1-dehydrogenase
MTARTIQTAVFDLVVVGATGDLARRKLLPALYRRDRAGQIPEGARILGAARAALDDAGWRAQAAEALEAFVPEAEQEAEAVERFLARLAYRAVDLGTGEGWGDLANALGRPGAQVRAIYLAIAPRFYADAARQAAEAGVLAPACGWWSKSPSARTWPARGR